MLCWGGWDEVEDVEMPPPDVRGRLAGWSSPPGLSGLRTISEEERLEGLGALVEVGE